MNESNLISKVWNFAHVLRDDGVGYRDYVEQITYLLFRMFFRVKPEAVRTKTRA